MTEARTNFWRAGDEVALNRLWGRLHTDIETASGRAIFDKAKVSPTQELTITAQALRMAIPAIEIEAETRLLRLIEAALPVPAPPMGFAAQVEEQINRAYANGHYDGINCDADSGFGIGECEHVGRFAASPSLAALPVPALDAAWARAEAAVAEWGGDMMVGHTTECPFCAGWWATASKRDYAVHLFPIIVSSEHGRPRGEHHDSTPAAALDALRAALSGSTKP